MEEYASFMDDTRHNFAEKVQLTLCILETVNFWIGQSSMRFRPLLFKVFKPSCLCLDEPFPSPSNVRFGKIIPEDPSSPADEVKIPV